jgi:small-conductance mechanosensitive channel
MKNAIAALLDDLDNPFLLWQAGILAVSLLAALLVRSLVMRHLREPEGAWKLGIGGAARVLFPLAALLVLAVGSVALKRWGGDGSHQALLHLAVALLVSLALVRIAVYVLRHVFGPKGWLSAWERSIAAVVWIGLALHLTGLLPGIVDILDDISVHLGRQRISLLMIFEAVLTIASSLVVSLWLGGEAERRIMKADKLDMNLRVVTAKFVRALLIFVGVMIALSAAGIDLTLLSVFGGALGVGLGFGLQKIASSYVSGFIILLDRSVRIGDLVTVDSRYGSITAITARYVVVKSMDGTEAIIPNEALITSTVLNHSYTNHEVRVGIPVQVSYDSPLEEAMRIMEDAAGGHERVLKEPAPRAYLKGFGDNGIDLELSLWINDPEEGQLNLRSEVNLAIWRGFRQAGIEIPYPQRDVRIIGPIPEEVAILGEQDFQQAEDAQ